MVKSIVPASLPAFDQSIVLSGTHTRMQQTLLGLKEAYARQAARLAELRAGGTPAKPTADDIAGMAWWNGLTEQRRSYWCRVAQTAMPKRAWDYYKLCREVESHLRD